MAYKSSQYGGRLDNSWIIWTAALDQRLETLWNQGQSLGKLAKDFKCSLSAVRRRINFLRAAGVYLQGRTKIIDQNARAKALPGPRKRKAPVPPPVSGLNDRQLYPLEAGHPLSWSCLWADTSMAQEVPPWPAL